MREDLSIIYKATKKNNNSKCGFNSIYTTLPNLESRVNYLYSFESTCKRPTAVTLLLEYQMEVRACEP